MLKLLSLKFFVSRHNFVRFANFLNPKSAHISSLHKKMVIPFGQVNLTDHMDDRVGPFRSF